MSTYKINQKSGELTMRSASLKQRRAMRRLIEMVENELIAPERRSDYFDPSMIFQIRPSSPVGVKFPVTA